MGQEQWLQKCRHLLVRCLPRDLWLRHRLNSRVKLTLLVLCALFANESIACSCLPLDMSSLEKGAELIVLAQLKTSSPSHDKKKFAFATIKTFKGVVGERFVVWTPKFEVSCGLRARTDVPYVLFVHREDNKLMVDHCSSWPLTREYFRYTDAFNEYNGLTGTEALVPSSNDQAGSFREITELLPVNSDQMETNDLCFWFGTKDSPLRKLHFDFTAADSGDAQAGR